MSKDMKTGLSSRRIMTIMAAVFAVAVMMCAPLFVAVDTDAAIADDETGLAVYMTDPADEELNKFTYGGGKARTTSHVCGFFLQIFDIDNVNESMTSDSFKYNKGWAFRFKDGAYESNIVTEVTAENIVLTLTYTDDGSLMIANPGAYNASYAEAAEKIKGELGNEVSIGDVLKITGNVKVRYLIFDRSEYAQVDSAHSVEKGASEAIYRIQTIDVNISLTHAGTTKTIGFYSDSKWMESSEEKFDYKNVDYKDLTNTSPCTISFTDRTYAFMTGGSHFTIAGTDYSVSPGFKKVNPIETTTTILTDSEVNVQDYRDEINSFPSTIASGTVTKTYQAGDELGSAILMDVAGNDILKGLLLVGGVILAIIILGIIIVVLVIVKRKK